MSDLGPIAAPPPAPLPATPAGQAPAGSQTPVAVPAPAAPPSGQGTGQQGTSGQPPASPAALLQGEAAEVSQSLNELARSGQTSAQVVARDNATLLVRTATGSTLALTNLAQVLEQANIAVLNAALRLQLNPANPQQASVTTANGVALQPPVPVLVQPPTTAQLALASAPPPSPAPGSATPAQVPQPGQTLAATVVSSPTGQAAALPQGSQLQVLVRSVSLPPATTAGTAPGAVPTAVPPPAASTPVLPTTAASGLPASSALPPGSGAVPAAAGPPAGTTTAAPTPSAALTSAPAPAVPPFVPPTGAGRPAPALPPGSQLQQGAAAPAGMPSGPTVQTGQVMTGVVSGQGQAGQVLVSTPQGVLALRLPNPLPPGTQISIELAAIQRPPLPAPTALTPAPLAGVLTRLQGEWPALQQTLDAIRAADPALAQRLQAELLPQPNARLAAAALQFMAAAAAGNAQAWLGSEAVRKLEQQGRADLLRKLDDDFRELGRLNQRQGDTEWQALTMPMLIGGRVEPIQIFMRRRRDRRKAQAQTRFIIDFDLESTGPIQFDGFVGTTQLDLILRSESDFGPAFRMDVTAIFTEALQVTGMTGSIRFHGREKPLAWPSPELEAVGPSTELKI